MSIIADENGVHYDDYDFAFERGTYFEDHDDPDIQGMVVIDTGILSGIPHLRIAEKDTSKGYWRAYWVKESYMLDEVHLGLTKQTTTLTDDMLTEVERNVERDFNWSA